MNDRIDSSKFKIAGYFFISGGAALLIECCLIFLGLVTVELPDHRIDIFSIALSTLAWILLLCAYVYLLRAGFLSGRRVVLWIAMMGLALYTLGCIIIMLSLWELVLIVPVGLIFTAVGTLLVGVFAFRSRSVPARISFALLAAGLYPFLFMLPIVAMYGAPNYMVNYFWGAPWVAIGIALNRAAAHRNK